MSAHRTIVAALFLLFATTGGTAQQSSKTGTPTGDPFAAKVRPAAGPKAEAARAFEQELPRVGDRLAAIRADVRARVTGASALMEKTELLRLAGINGGPVDLVTDERNGVAMYIRGKRLVDDQGPVKQTLAARAERSARFLRENSKLLRVDDPATEFVQTNIETDHLGMTHVRYQQMYKGIEVWGRDARVHIAADGSVESYNGRTIPTPVSVDLRRERITEQSARRVAEADAGRGLRSGETRRVIDVDGSGQTTLCWQVNVTGALDENYYVFVDAETGQIVRKYNHVFYDGPVVGSGTNLGGQTRTVNAYQLGSNYYMIDASKTMFKPGTSTLPQDGKGVIYTLDARNADSSLFFVVSANVNSWGNPSAVSASYNASKVYDYFKTVHNRDAIDGAGSTMNTVVKFKTNFNNAFWNGQLMVFGTGDGVAFSDLAASVDVTAHEMAHGVVERTANLVYENQPGALNESFADVFGVLFEFWLEPATANWFIGETITTPAIPGDALRRMDDPGASNIAFNGQQPAHMNQYQNLPNTANGDHGGVHVNSGIPNKAFYLFATSTGVTKEEAGQVYYRALSQYLTRNSNFVDCRLAVIKAAEDLYGGVGNPKALAAAAAFDAVGISGGSGAPPPPTQPPVQGSHFLAVMDGGNGILYRSGTTGANLTQLTTGGLSTRPTVTDDGSLIYYVDGSGNLHVVTSAGTNDQTLSSSGGFNNVSVSPNGRYLAATSTGQEARIYLFDLQAGGPAKVLPLYTPTYSQGVNTGNILYPDRLDWASDSRILMYDALNRITTTSGTVDYWDINLLRVADTAIARLFPPQASDVNIGNAVFASNSDNIIAFDYFRGNDSVRVMAVDLNKGSIAQVTNNIFSLGSPSFSHDDRSVFYHYITQSSRSIWVVGLASDGITGTGNDQSIITGGIYPVAFSTGTRTSVPEGEGLPLAFGLRPAYPNPFNPSTQITYSLDVAGEVSLRVFDLLGREVAVLDAGQRTAGVHTAVFQAASLPSGTYVIRLESGARVASTRVLLIK